MGIQYPVVSPLSYPTNIPSVEPDSDLTLDYDFRRSSGSTIGSVVKRGPVPIFTRATAGWHFNAAKVLVEAAIDEPRFDHDPVTGAALGLLREEERENLCLQSENLATTWQATSTTLTGGQTAPDGTASAFDVLHDDNDSSMNQNFTVTDNTVYCVSVFIKQGVTGSHDWVQFKYDEQSGGPNGIRGWWDLSNSAAAGQVQAEGTGTLTATGVIDEGGGWYRIWMSGQIASGQTDARIQFFNATADASTTEEDTNSVLWWGFQLEIGTFPTSYIPTTTIAVTRAADVCSTTDVGWLNQSAGALYVEANTIGAFTGGVISLNDSTSDERIDITVVDADDGWLDITVGGISEAVWSSSVAMNIDVYANGAFVKSAIAYELNNANAAVNGVAGDVDTEVTIPTTDRLYVGVDPFGRQFSGHITQVKYWNVRKPDGFLQNITV